MENVRCKHKVLLFYLSCFCALILILCDIKTHKHEATFSYKQTWAQSFIKQKLLNKVSCFFAGHRLKISTLQKPNKLFNFIL